MKRSVRWLTLALMIGVAGEARAASDPAALAVVDRMLRATGGADAPYRCQKIAFTFAVEKDGKTVTERRHVWRPSTGEHRVSGKNREGSEYAIEWNLNTRKGTATQAGAALEGKPLDQAMEKAWGLWVNDTYWLLMPYKLRDPGVSLASEGRVTVEGKSYDKVRVTFDKVGLTPGDTYWVFIAPDSDRVERWEFVLEGQQPPATPFIWTDYKKLGPLTVALSKAKVAAPDAPSQVIVFRDVEVE